jgi:hypothetical protein
MQLTLGYGRRKEYSLLTKATFVLVLAILIRNTLLLEATPKAVNPDIHIIKINRESHTDSPLPKKILNKNLSPVHDSPASSRQSVGRNRGYSDAEHHSSGVDLRAQTRSMLRLVYLLEKALPTSVGKSVAEWAMSRSTIISDMLNAMEGNYHCVLQLVATLNSGSAIKGVLDSAIDKCDLLNHLREAILVQRISTRD